MQVGIVLTGGMARLQGLAERISTEMGVPVQVASDPELKVVQGLHRSSGQIVELARFIINSKDRRGRV